MNIMIDIETMGIGPSAPVLSIGAVAFDTEIRKSFYVEINTKSLARRGFVPEFGTVVWWMGQSDQAREFIMAGAAKGVDIEEALTQLSSFIGLYDKAELWSNGADFDLVILKSAYEKCDMALPWTCRDVTCFRTFKKLFPKLDQPFDGVQHNAHDDALHQAKYVIRVNERRLIGGTP